MEFSKHLKIFNKNHSQQALCSACHQPIRKHFIKCSGPCERNFHKNCIIYDKVDLLKFKNGHKKIGSAINLCEKCEHAEQNLMTRMTSLNQHLEELKKLDLIIQQLRM